MPHEFEMIPVTGQCDAGCGRPAAQWFGNTSSATCGAGSCTAIMNERYEEHCAEVDAQIEFEKEMVAMYGANAC